LSGSHAGEGRERQQHHPPIRALEDRGGHQRGDLHDQRPGDLAPASIDLLDDEILLRRQVDLVGQFHDMRQSRGKHERRREQGHEEHNVAEA
jgi:hypothetical protein